MQKLVKFCMILFLFILYIPILCDSANTIIVNFYLQFYLHFFYLYALITVSINVSQDVVVTLWLLKKIIII